MYNWTVESTTNSILAIPLPPHQYQQQSKLRKERWWMLPNLQTLPLNPHPSVSSTSQMNWSPMRWIVLCFSTNHSWMHSKPFTSIRLAIWPSHVFTVYSHSDIEEDIIKAKRSCISKADYANELQLICGKSKVYKVIDEMLLNDVHGSLSFVYLKHLRMYWMMCYWVRDDYDYDSVYSITHNPPSTYR